MLREEFVDVVLARLATVQALLEEAVQVADHLSVRLEVLGCGALDRLREALDEPIQRLLPEPFGQRVEPVAGGRLHEVVLLELADPAADVARQRVELVDPAGRRVAQHRPQRRVGRRAVRRAGRLVEAALDARPLLGDDLVELLPDVGQDVAELIPLLELLTPSPQSLAELVEPRQIVAGGVARPPAALDEAAEGLGEVAFGHDVVGHRLEDLVGVESRDRLRSVPPGVAGGAVEQRIAPGRRGAGRLQVARVRRERRGHRGARHRGRAPALIGGRRCRRIPSGPC